MQIFKVLTRQTNILKNIASHDFEQIPIIKWMPNVSVGISQPCLRNTTKKTCFIHWEFESSLNHNYVATDQESSIIGEKQQPLKLKLRRVKYT